MTMATLEPRVYVACLGCYNAGTLHGEWFAADDSLPDAVASHFNATVGPFSRPGDDDDDDSPRCAVSGGEEFVVHDHEGFGAYNPGECGYAEAAEIGQALIDADNNAEALAAYCSHVGTAPQDLGRHDFSDAFAGEWPSLEEFAEHLAGECDDIPDKWAPYIDWERYARDLELGGDVFTVDCDSGVYVFWNR